MSTDPVPLEDPGAEGDVPLDESGILSPKETKGADKELKQHLNYRRKLSEVEGAVFGNVTPEKGHRRTRSKEDSGAREDLELSEEEDRWSERKGSTPLSTPGLEDAEHVFSTPSPKKYFGAEVKPVGESIEPWDSHSSSPPPAPEAVSAKPGSDDDVKASEPIPPLPAAASLETDDETVDLEKEEADAVDSTSKTVEATKPSVEEVEAKKEAPAGTVSPVTSMDGRATELADAEVKEINSVKEGADVVVGPPSSISSTDGAIISSAVPIRDVDGAGEGTAGDDGEIDESNESGGGIPSDSKVKAPEVSSPESVAGLVLNYDAGPVTCLVEDISDDSDSDEEPMLVRRSPLPPKPRTFRPSSLHADEMDGLAPSPVRPGPLSRFRPDDAMLLVSPEVVGRLSGIAEAGPGEEIESTDTPPSYLSDHKSVSKGAAQYNDGWQVYETEDNVTYFYNEITGISQWHEPVESKRPASTHVKGDAHVTVKLPTDVFGGVTPGSADSPLHAAVSYGYSSDEEISRLIDGGADVSAVNADGETPLHYATTYAYIFGIEQLIGAGADPNATDIYGRSPMFGAINAGEESDECMTYLRSLGGHLDVSDYSGDTLLHAAAANGNTPCVTLLLVHAALLLDVQNSSGCTALHIAAAAGQPLVVKSLLDAGASSALKNHSGFTPWRVAADAGNNDCSTLLPSDSLELVPVETSAADLEELELLRVKVEELEMEASALSAANDTLRGQMEVKDEQKLSLESEYSNLKKEFKRFKHAASSNVQRYKAKLEAAVAKEEKIMGSLRTASENHKSMLVALQDAKKQNKVLTTRANGLQRSVKERGAQVTDLEGQLYAAQETVESWAASYAEMQASNAELTSLLESMTAERDALKGAAATAMVSTEASYPGASDYVEEIDLDESNKEAADDAWEIFVAEDGQKYHYNRVTEEYYPVEEEAAAEGSKSPKMSATTKSFFETFNEANISVEEKKSVKFKSRRTKNFFQTFRKSHKDLLEEEGDGYTSEEWREYWQAHPEEKAAYDAHYASEAAEAGANGAVVPTSPQRITQIWGKFLENSIKAQVEGGLSSAGEDSIFDAVAAGDLAAVSEHLKAGVSPDIMDSHATTPLHLACSLGALGVIAVLVEFGADINLPSGKTKTTPLHVTIRNSHYECFRYLLESMAAVNIANHKGNNALHIAAMAGEERFVQALLDYDADPALTNKKGRFPLDYFVKHHGLKESGLDEPYDRVMELLSNIPGMRDTGREVEKKAAAKVTFMKPTAPSLSHSSSEDAAASKADLTTDSAILSDLERVAAQVGADPTPYSSEGGEEGVGSFWGTLKGGASLVGKLLSVRTGPSPPPVAHMGSSGGIVWDEAAGKWVKKGVEGGDSAASSPNTHMPPTDTEIRKRLSPENVSPVPPSPTHLKTGRGRGRSYVDPFKSLTSDPK